MNDQRSPGSQPSRLRGLLAVGAVLLASGAVGFVAYRLAVRPIRRTIDSVSVVPPVPAASGPADARAGADIASLPPGKVPERLPEIQLPGTDGTVHRLEDWKGKPVVVNFWATWCDPCRREIPLLRSLRHEHAADRLEIVGIAIDYAGAVRKYATEHGIDYPVLIGDKGGLAAASAFGMDTVLPFSVFADRKGRVVALKIGELHRDEAELILDRLREVDAGRLAIPAAQKEISAGIQRLRMARSELN